VRLERQARTDRLSSFTLIPRAGFTVSRRCNPTRRTGHRPVFYGTEAGLPSKMPPPTPTRCPAFLRDADPRTACPIVYPAHPPGSSLTFGLFLPAGSTRLPRNIQVGFFAVKSHVSNILSRWVSAAVRKLSPRHSQPAGRLRAPRDLPQVD